MRSCKGLPRSRSEPSGLTSVDDAYLSRSCSLNRVNQTVRKTHHLLELSARIGRALRGELGRLYEKIDAFSKGTEKRRRLLENEEEKLRAIRACADLLAWIQRR